MRSVSENINALVKRLKEINIEITWLVVLDEVQMRQSQCDLSDLESCHENIQLHLAISPLMIGGIEDTNLKFPEDERTHVEKLVSWHRNSYEISLFLKHLKSYDQNSAIYKLMDDLDDLPIAKTTFPRGNIPLLIEIDSEISENILQAIKNKYISPSEQNIVLLYDKSLQGDGKWKIHDWCRTQLWKFVYFKNMTGSEADVVVVICQMSGYFIESFFRARSKLIVVQR